MNSEYMSPTCTRATYEGFLSRRRTGHPNSSRVWAALRPAKPPPTTILRCDMFVKEERDKLGDVYRRGPDGLYMGHGNPIISKSGRCWTLVWPRQGSKLHGAPTLY
jgi:hypothetical protein